VFHRDVKSSNIVLDDDDNALIIDCGLAKFVLQDGNAALDHTMMTRTSQHFFTPGYACPMYINSKVYDAKSEIYSVGIVFMEILFGRVQCREQDGLLYHEHTLEDNTSLVPDVRAGEWPASCVEKICELISGCVVRYLKRTPSMMVVMRKLREIADEYCKSSKAEEASLKRLSEYRARMMELELRDSVRQRLEEELRRKEEQRALQEVRRCVICCDDDWNMRDGLECNTDSGQAHFYCLACFSWNIISQTSPMASYRGHFAAHQSRIVCQLCLMAGQDLEECMFTERQVAVSADDTALESYRQACNELLEVEICKREAARFSILLEEMRVQVQVQDAKTAQLNRHRLHIAENILTIKCPRAQCGQAFFDFNGCFALTCDSCTCGFCAWCLVDCGRDAHAHVKACPYAPPAFKGSYSGSIPEFNRVHSARRAELVRAYLHSRVSEEDSDSLKALIERDLSDLDIAF